MEQELKDFGLTDKEVQVYLALLGMGTALVQEIAKKARTYRTYTYEILKSLKEKGLVSYVIKSGKQYFEVAEPEKLLDILKEKETKIKEILPDLKKTYNSSGEKPKIEIYEGKEGIKTILDDMIKSKEEILVYGSTKNQLSLLTFYFPNFIKRRVNEKIKTRVVTEKSKETLEIKKNDTKELRKMRFFPKDLNFPTVTNIYGKKISILSFKDNITGVVINNEDITKTQREIFNLLWNSAKPK